MRQWSLVCLFIVVATTAPASAQDVIPAEPTENAEVDSGEQAELAARREEARSLFLAGRTAFEHGRFENALSHFRASYELFPAPELLYNIGQAADRLRRDDEALEALSGFLEARPQSTLREQVESRIRTLREVVESRSLGSAPESSDESEPTDESEPSGEVDPTEGDTLLIAEVAAPSSPPRTWLALLLPGAAVLAGGAVLTTVGLLDVRAVENAGPTDYPDLRHRDERSALLSGLGFVSLGLGAALLTVGLLMRPRAEDSSGLRVDVGLGCISMAGSL